MFNLFAGYSVNDRMSLRMGVDNLLNEEPPIYGSRPGDRNADVTRPDHYDILGRRAYVGLKLTF
jgi:outer membrane receptor protein involved in Fe transport